VALLAGGSDAMFVAVEGAEDDLDQGAADLKKP
jgi:N-acetylmuramic acid 6-phosphate etherase